MHELSICRSIVNSILEEMGTMDPKPKRLVRARIVAGELRQVVPEFMQDAYRSVVRGTELEGSELEIRQASLRGHCEDCGWTGDWSTDLFECGSCHSRKLKMEGGMELYLDNLEIEH